jgi:hypothetical protein
MQHTPEPWILSGLHITSPDKSTCTICPADTEGTTIAWCAWADYADQYEYEPKTETERLDKQFHLFGPDYDTARANAKLIAAAPKLLRLLSMMFNKYENGVRCFEDFFEDPENCTSYIGNAVNLDSCEIDEIAGVLNELDPK